MANHTNQKNHPPLITIEEIIEKTKKALALPPSSDQTHVLIENGADPWVISQNGNLYYCTNDHETKQKILISKFKTLNEIASAPLVEDVEVAQRFNDIHRFAALDLIFGHRDEKVQQWLIEHGMQPEEYEWFMENGNMNNTVLGIDYYPACIREFTTSGMKVRGPRDESEFEDIVKTYGDRYGWPPVLIMEFNAKQEEVDALCDDIYKKTCNMRQEGYPVIGLTYFGDKEQIGWEVGLVGPKAYEKHNVGLYDGNKIAKAGEIFRDLAAAGLVAYAISRGIGD